MRVLILANGEPPSQALLARLVDQHDLFLAVDGAARTAHTFGLSPDIISGDFDSVSFEEAQRLSPKAECVRTPDQNYTDLEKALRLAQERGATHVSIAGASGGRIDHALGAISLLLMPWAGMTLALVGEGSETRAVSEAWACATQPGDIISLLSLEGQASVTVSGVQWPLAEERLPIGTRGISNTATGEEVVVRVRGGTVIVCHLEAGWARHPLNRSQEVRSHGMNSEAKKSSPSKRRENG